MAPIVFAIAGWQAILLCILFAILYVGSLYIWSGAVTSNRDDPQTIKRRFMSVGVISIIVPLLLRCFGTTSTSSQAYSLFEWLGVKFSGFLPAVIVPLFLTMSAASAHSYIQQNISTYSRYMLVTTVQCSS